MYVLVVQWISLSFKPQSYFKKYDLLIFIHKASLHRNGLYAKRFVIPRIKSNINCSCKHATSNTHRACIAIWLNCTLPYIINILCNVPLRYCFPVVVVRVDYSREMLLAPMHSYSLILSFMQHYSDWRKVQKFKDIKNQILMFQYFL